MLIWAAFLAFLLPAFVCSKYIHFIETFESDPFTTGKWATSQVSQYVDQPLKRMPARRTGEGFENDYGLQLTMDLKHYGFGTMFSEPISLNIENDLLIQYEVKFEDGLNCGGAYIKLLREGSIVDLDNNTPYSVMFGPDKCGGTSKVHFIVQFQNPITKVWEEKHFNESVPVKTDQNTHLYSLVIHPNNNFDILVDNEIAGSGNLLTHMSPSIVPSKLIDDPTDYKPSNWVDEAQIPDISVQKPEDWDESQPRKIPDPKAIKPAEWDEKAPSTISDPEAKKPDDWDDEEDGEWEPPLIANPVCEISGCGPWTPPTIINPQYKGKWYPPMIPNPEYIGEWKPKQIINEAYFEVENPLKDLAPISGLAIEVWTTNAGIHFDNFLISNDIHKSKEFTENTFSQKKIAESKMDKEEARAIKEKEFSEVMEKGTIGEKIKIVAVYLLEFLSDNPLALGATIFAISFPLVYLLFFGGKVEEEDLVEPKEETKEENKEEPKNEDK